MRVVRSDDGWRRVRGIEAIGGREREDGEVEVYIEDINDDAESHD